MLAKVIFWRTEAGIRKCVGRISLVAAACLTLLIPLHSAEAQSAVRPSVLTQIQSAEDHGRIQIQLTFTPGAPKFSNVEEKSPYEAGIALASTARAASARAPMDLRGLIRGLSFQQVGPILILKFVTAEPVDLSTSQTASNALTITAKPRNSNTASYNTSHDSGFITASTVTSGLASHQPLPNAAAPQPGGGGFEIVPLKYADVSEVVGLLSNGASIKPNDAFTPDQPNFGSAGISGSGAYNPVPPPSPDEQDMPLGQTVDQAIGVDRRLNAIILRGSPDQIARLKAEIEKIDVPVKSVILQTTFVELNRNGARKVGLDFNNANSQIATSTLQIGQFIPPGFTSSKPLNSLSLQAAIYAQVSKGNGRIISKPRIAAQSGTEAKIITGDALPILTSIALSGVNGVSQQVQYVNVGVTLQIAPRVASSGFVTSHVFCVVSSVTGYSQGYPTISQRKAQTSVTVKDGASFVIGGLTQENDIANDAKVPILGDIPILRDIFDVRKGTNSKTELYIVVTPHIINGNAAAVLPALSLQNGAMPNTDRLDAASAAASASRLIQSKSLNAQPDAATDSANEN